MITDGVGPVGKKKTEACGQRNCSFRPRKEAATEATSLEPLPANHCKDRTRGMADHPERRRAHNGGIEKLPVLCAENN